METKVKARKIGGSIGVIIPNDITIKQKISPNDVLTIKVEKLVDLSFMFGKGKNIKKTTEKIMEEIDEGE